MFHDTKTRSAGAGGCSLRTSLSHPEWYGADLRLQFEQVRPILLLASYNPQLVLKIRHRGSEGSRDRVADCALYVLGSERDLSCL